MKGQKQDKSNTTKQALRQVQTVLGNLQMGLKIGQMVAQQNMNNLARVDQDVQRSFNVVNNLDYRTRALLELLDVDSDKLNEIANGFRLKDFNKASDEEDKKQGFTIDDDGVVGEKSIVIMTSSAKGEDGEDVGIFRTKFAISESPLPTLKEKLLGQKVGFKFNETVNGVDHSFELLSLRLIPEKKEKAEVKLTAVPDAQEEATEEVESTEE